MAHPPSSSPRGSYEPRLLRLLTALALTGCGGIAVLPDGGGGGDGGSSGDGGSVSTCGDDPPPPPPGYQGFTYCFPLPSCVQTPAVDEQITENLVAAQPDCGPCGCYLCDLTVQEVCQQGGQCCFTGYAGVKAGGCIGRPFTVADQARVAPLVERNDWRTDLAPASELAPEIRAALAELWANDALFEHASVASFARHVLELLSVGAPADLILEAQRALADEIEHARLCFALAARYGTAVGPGPLDLSGSQARTTLAEIAEATAREGCVVETISALVAARARDLAEDPVARAALDRIAEDEWRHAELSWRVVRWALATGGDEVRAAVRRGFAGASFHAVGGADGLAAHGRLSTNEMQDVADRAMAEVIAPCVRALFGALATLRELAA